MQTRTRTGWAKLLLPLPLLFALQSPAQRPAQEIWLMAGKQAVALAESDASVLAKLDVGENAFHLAASPDGNMVAIASYGAAKSSVTWSGIQEIWPEPGSRSQITLVKRPGYEIAAQYQTPFRPAFLHFTPDGSALAVVSLGQVSKNEKKHIAPQVFVLEIASGKLRGQVELASEPIAPWLTANRLILPCEGFAQRPGAPPELVIYDLASGKAEKTPLPSSPKSWRDTGAGNSRYLELQTGVLTIDAEGKLAGAPIQAGSEKLFLLNAPSSARLLLAGKTKKQGELAVIENGRVVKTLNTQPLRTILFDAKQTRMILCAEKEAAIYGWPELNEQVRFPLPGAFREIRLDPSEKRLYVNELGDNVSVIDLETKQVAARFVTGRGGIKFLKELGAASANALGQMQYAISGIPGSYVTIPNAVQSLAFAPSGKFVYVFNDQTRDITVVETKGHTSVRKTPTGAGSWGGSLFISPDNRYLVSSGLNKLLVFDLETGEAVTDQEFKGAIPHYVPSLGLVFLRSATGAEIYRPAPMEKVKDLGAEAALPNEKQLPAASPGRLSIVNPTLFEPQTRRFFLFTAKGTSVYDYDLKMLRQIEGLFGVERVLLAPTPGSHPANP